MEAFKKRIATRKAAKAAADGLSNHSDEAIPIPNASANMDIPVNDDAPLSSDTHDEPVHSQDQPVTEPDAMTTSAQELPVAACQKLSQEPCGCGCIKTHTAQRLDMLALAKVPSLAHKVWQDHIVDGAHLFQNDPSVHLSWTRRMIRFTTQLVTELEQVGVKCFQCEKLVGTVTGGLKKCTACQFAKYCGATCQKNHWSMHKTECKKLRKFRDHFVNLLKPYFEELYGTPLDP